MKMTNHYYTCKYNFVSYKLKNTLIKFFNCHYFVIISIFSINLFASITVLFTVRYSYEYSPLMMCCVLMTNTFDKETLSTL